MTHRICAIIQIEHDDERLFGISEDDDSWKTAILDNIPNNITHVIAVLPLCVVAMFRDAVINGAGDDKTALTMKNTKMKRNERRPEE